MTTIALRNGVMAGDTQVTEGDTLVASGCRKVRRLRDGRLYGFSGDIEQGEIMLRALRKGEAPPKLRGIKAILVYQDGVVSLWEGAIWIKQQHAPFFAIGNGTDFALGAMAAGADAKQAVKIAMKFDTATGGRVQTVRL